MPETLSTVHAIPFKSTKPKSLSESIIHEAMCNKSLNFNNSSFMEHSLLVYTAFKSNKSGF